MREVMNAHFLSAWRIGRAWRYLPRKSRFPPRSDRLQHSSSRSSATKFHSDRFRACFIWRSFFCWKATPARVAFFDFQTMNAADKGERHRLEPWWRYAAAQEGEGSQMHGLVDAEGLRCA